MAKRWFAASVLIAGALAPDWTQGATVQLSFSGTYDTDGATVFGLSGPAVPYSFGITYDTALDTNPFFFPTGATLGSDITTHPWYGYSASGITGTSLTFGTKTWTAAALSPRIPAIGVSADLWLDADISASQPTLCWALLSGGGTLQLGAGQSAFGNIFMAPVSRVAEPGVFPPEGNSSNLSVQAVPEPCGVALLIFAGLWRVGRRRVQGFSFKRAK
jgi:hypothetical protein